MAKVIAVTNQKGGVGKTTVSVDLAFALHAAGHKVLYVDLDGQGHGSIYVSGDGNIVNKKSGAERLFDNIEGLQGDVTESGIDLLHGHRDLARLDEGEKTSADALALKSYVSSLPYDFIVIDTPPALQLRQFAAMIWSDLLVIVVEPEEMALRGFLKVKEVMELLKGKKLLSSNHKWKVLFNKVDPRRVDQQKVIDGFIAQYKDAVVPLSLIERKALVQKSYSARIPVWELPGTPKEVGAIWRSLPNVLGLI